MASDKEIFDSWAYTQDELMEMKANDALEYDTNAPASAVSGDAVETNMQNGIKNP